MKRILALVLLSASAGLALPTFQGTKGTNFVSSARCEDMGFLWFYITSEGYQEHVIFQDSGGTVQAEYDNWALKPSVSIGFTPWHYLEFSAYGSGYFYLNTDSAASAFGLSDVGGHVKGSIPLTPINSEKPLKMALGLDGFFLMSLPFEIDAAANQRMSQFLGYYPFDQSGPEFGGKLLYSLESRYISGHVNAGYWYRSAHTIDTATVQFPQTIIGGVGIESSPWPWLNVFADFNLNYGLSIMTPDTLEGISTHASLGARFPIMMGRNKGFGLLFTLAGGADPLNFGSSMSLYAGIGIGGDLIRPKEKKIEGIVKDAETGKPIVQAKIELSNETRDTVVYTDSAGRFVLPLLKEGERIEVTKEGYYPESRAAEEIGEEIALSLELDPIKLSWLAGVVSDAETMEPVGGIIRFDEMETGQILEPVSADPVTGYFRLNIPPGLYNMATSAKGYRDDRRTIAIRTAQDTIVDIFLSSVEKPKQEMVSVTISGFGKGQTRLNFEQMAQLEKIAEMLAADADATAVITGHTDSVGNESSNIRVGEARARAVAEFLVTRGIDARRLHVQSAGERMPVGDNRYRSGRSSNRRVEIKSSTTSSGSGDAETGGVKPPTVK